MDFKPIIKKHKLTKAEQKKLYTEIDKTLKKINTQLSNLNIKAIAELGGSAAKGTMLKGDFDVDVFVRFDYSYKNQNISDLLEKALKPFKPQRVPGSRDYFQFSYQKINYEIVPVLIIDNWKQARNVTDASPLHVEWVSKRTKSKPKLIDQIILTKLFLKANNLYGAESYIKGFSGHVVDILVIHFGGFMLLLKAAQHWKQAAFIDPEAHFKGNLNKSKKGPLIAIDPVQPDRNAAAALNQENFRKFTNLAKQFIENPAEKYFIKQKLTKAKLLKKAGKNKIIILEAAPLKGKTDVMGAKLLKAFEHIAMQLKKHDFIIKEKGWQWDKKGKALFYYILDPEPLPKFKEHVGPFLNQKAHVEQFEKQHQNTYVKNRRINAKITREYRKAEPLIKELLNKQYLKEKVKKITLNI